MISASKITAPPDRSSVPRPRLLDALDPGSRPRLILVCAPAGAGKTTLLTAWAARAAGRVAWVSLDESDDDPVRFAAALWGAAAAAAPELDLPAPGTAPENLAAWIDAFCSALAGPEAGRGPGLSIVLDDCHLLLSPAVQAGLARLLSSLPSSTRLVLSTRADPALPLSRLRARGELAEIRAADLLFTAAEAGELLNRQWRLGLSEAQVTALAARTEGWAAGLHLAALSLRGRDDPAAFIRAFDGTHRHVLDYLVDEVLARQTSAVQEFLLATSVLSTLCGSLCDALTGRGDGQETLETLDAGNVFVSALDERRQWYRYHGLFSDALRARLARSAVDSAALHRAAAGWLQEHGMADAAVPHALAARRYADAAALIESVADRVMQRGRETTFVRWLDEIPAPSLAEHPVLVLYRDVAQAAERFAGTPGGGPIATGCAAAARAIAEYSAGRLEACVPFAQDALAALPVDRAWLRGTIALLAATVAVHRGEFAAAGSAIEPLLSRALSDGNVSTAAMCQRRLCEIDIALGRLTRADERCGEALGLAFGGHAPLPARVASWFLIARARVHLRAGAWDECARVLSNAEAVAVESDGLVSADLFQARACLCAARGETAQARTLWRQAAVHPPLPSWMDPPDPGGPEARGALVALLTGDTDAARAWGASSGAGVRAGRLEQGESTAGAAYLSAVRDAEVLARLRLADGMHDEARRIAGLVVEAAGRHGHVDAEVSARIVQTLALDALGRADDARAAMDASLAAAAPHGLVGSFVLGGEPLGRLLYRACDGSQARFAGRVLAAFPAAGAARACHDLPDPLVEPLSPREIDVLRLLAEGLSNKEISDRLFVSEKTVKWHATNVYGKLGVARRTQAIARARQLNILSRGEGET